MTTPVRKKLIEVSIPLEAINAASAREKSIRHGHPSTLHLWWARRPLAACRAVLFAQLVDDPSAWPDRFPTEAAQDAERRRLHKVIEAMVPWEASNNETIINSARWEIARSVAWGLGEEPPPPSDGKAILDYLQTKAPPVYDPFSGGGSIPLEAQRLGLRAYGSDLNPVAVLIGKALVEIPPKFAGLPPVNPEAQAELKRGGSWNGKGALGLAADVRYYGKWMRDEAEKQIGHLYPKVTLPDGTEGVAIAWLWARTVRSPDPAAKGAMVPLVSSFMLCTKAGRKAWVQPTIDPSATDGWRFEVKKGELEKVEEDEAKKGTKVGRGSNFSCVLTGCLIDGDWVKAEGLAGRMRVRLMAIVAKSGGNRVYLSPNRVHEESAEGVIPDWTPEGNLPNDPRNFWTVQYGLGTFASLFTPRQIVALSSLSDKIIEVRERIRSDAGLAGLSDDRRLFDNGLGAAAYADAVATYLAFALSKLSTRSCTQTTWYVDRESTMAAFSRQVVPMTWDFAEMNTLLSGSGSFDNAIAWESEAIEFLGAAGSFGKISNLDAAKGELPVRPAVISSDPPYYDNIGYSDLSDFFYIWLKRALHTVWPDLFRRLLTPKFEELVATPYRHGSKLEAESFFMRGMANAFIAIRDAASDNDPIAIYYAFKQSEIADGAITSAGWASFLQAIINSGLLIDGTWPIRTEQPHGLRVLKANALASSVVLVCRKRSADASILARADFLGALKREMPGAIEAIRKAGVGPVDMQQSVIGPGMGVFSRHAKVLEDDDSPMTVKTALALINRVWEEIENELDAAFDPETQVALAWYGSYAFESRPSGELITLTTAKNTSDRALFQSGVFEDRRGRTALTPRQSLPADWTPAGDKHLTVWECVQHVARTLNAEDGGTQAAGRLVAQMGPKSADARKLAYRLFEIATQKGWSAEALVYNELAEVWPKLEDLASGIDPRPEAALVVGPAQGTLL